MTYDTGNPVPSAATADIDDNAQAFDRFLHNETPSEPDRFGRPRKTWWQMEQDAAALVSPNVAALASVTSSADKMLMFVDSSGNMSTIDSGTLGRLLLALVNDSSGKSSARTALQVVGTADVIPLTNGGTGATSAAAARTALGIVTGPWANLPLANGWAIVVTRAARYRIFMDMVQLEVSISGGTVTNGTIVANLPVGFRPPNAFALPIVTAPATTPSSSVTDARVVVSPDGTIVCQNVTASSGISFITQFSITA